MPKNCTGKNTSPKSLVFHPLVRLVLKFRPFGRPIPSHDLMTAMAPILDVRGLAESPTQTLCWRLVLWLLRSGSQRRHFKNIQNPPKSINAPCHLGFWWVSNIIKWILPALHWILGGFHKAMGVLRGSCGADMAGMAAAAAARSGIAEPVPVPTCRNLARTQGK